MGYADHDDPGADAPGAFGAFRAVHHENADGIRYVDSGVSPYVDSGVPPDADTGVYPVIDWYAGYERFAGDQAGDQPTAAPRTAGEQPFTRVYARPANPREASSPGGEPGWMRDLGRRPAAGYPDDPPRAAYTGRPPRAGYPDELPIAGYPGESSLADYPADVTPARRLARLRPDRWIIAGGGLAAAVATAIAFATAGGSTATRPPTTQSATGHVTQPACVSPAPGH
jgi:hypothetical protein